MSTSRQAHRPGSALMVMRSRELCSNTQRVGTIVQSRSTVSDTPHNWALRIIAADGHNAQLVFGTVVVD